MFSQLNMKLFHWRHAPHSDAMTPTRRESVVQTLLQHAKLPTQEWRTDTARTPSLSSSRRSLREHFAVAVARKSQAEPEAERVQSSETAHSFEP